MLIAGIDQGTNSTKGVLLADDAHVEILPAFAHRQILPQPGWVEHDPLELLVNVEELVGQAVRLGAGGIGLANQGETVIAWDRATGIPICNAIVWQDQRTAEAIERLRADGKAEEVRRRSGLPLDCYFSASKLAWILQSVPEATVLARSGRLGLGTSDAYLLERLMGRYVTDVTTASRTALMNLETCAWDPVLCEIFGVPGELLPRIVREEGPLGELPASRSNLPVYASMADQIAALYGHGCRKPGDGKLTVGTGAFALILASFGTPMAVANGAASSAAWLTPGGRAYVTDGGVYSAGAALEWLMRVGLLKAMNELDCLTGESAVSRGAAFVPALAGLAFPHWDRTAAGLLIGIDIATSRQDIIKAVLEGVAFRIAEMIDALGFLTGVDIPVDGGLVGCLYFMQFLADISQRRFRLRDGVGMTALGAARFALDVAEGHIAKFAPRLSLRGKRRVSPEMAPARAAELRGRFEEARLKAVGWR